MPGPQADLQYVTDVAVPADGGVVFAEGNYEGRRTPGLVRYLSPPAADLLAVAVRRDGNRIFVPARPGAITVTLNTPALISVTVKRASANVSTETLWLPAGDSRIALPPLAGAPHMVGLVAYDANGRVAHDRAAIIPAAGWPS